MNSIGNSMFNREDGILGVAHAMNELGAIGFVFGPPIGLFINDVKHDSDESNFINSSARTAVNCTRS